MKEGCTTKDQKHMVMVLIHIKVASNHLLSRIVIPWAEVRKYPLWRLFWTPGSAGKTLPSLLGISHSGSHLGHLRRSQAHFFLHFPEGSQSTLNAMPLPSTLPSKEPHSQTLKFLEITLAQQFPNPWCIYCPHRFTDQRCWKTEGSGNKTLGGSLKPGSA